MTTPNHAQDRCERESRLSRAITMAIVRAELINAIDRALMAGTTGPDIMAIVHERINRRQRSAMCSTAVTPQWRQI